MKHYKRIFIWEDKKRIDILLNFRKLVIDYFNNIKRLGFGYRGVKENKISSQTRVEINQIINKVHSVIVASGINPSMYYSPPPAVGGLAGNIDLVQNIFNLYHFDIEPNFLLDFIDRSIGIYQENLAPSLLRTINPFYWMYLFLEFIAGLPFKLLGIAGFNQAKIEDALIGRFIKLIFALITVIASFLTILHLLGYLEDFKNYFLK